MNIQKHSDTINACRFCFMCRHLSAIGNVSFRESDTPRGRALLAGLLQRLGKDFDKDGVDAYYRSELSAANRFHCVSHYDEAGLILAARQDIVELCIAPDKVKALAEELSKSEFNIEGKGDVVYALDSYTESQAEVIGSFAELAGKLAAVGNADAAKALKVLGFEKDAAAVAKRFAKAVKGFKTLVASSPAIVDAFKNDFKLDGVEVLHSSEYLLNLKLKGNAKKAVYLLDSDFLKNYNGNADAPKSLLKSLGYELKLFGTNQEESFSAGEGALVFDKLNPELAAKLCGRIKELCDNPGKDLIVVCSPYTRSVLAKYVPKLKAISIEEAAALAARS